MNRAVATIPAAIAIALLASACGKSASPPPSPSAPAPAPVSTPAAPVFDWAAAFASEPIEIRDLGDGLVVRVHAAGDAASTPAAAGDTIEIAFRARRAVADGPEIEFDSSDRRGAPLRVPLIDGSAVPGLLRGLEGLRAGDVARIEIPPSLGYGKAGRGQIPADARLVFDVRVIAVSPAPSTPRATPTLHP